MRDQRPQNTGPEASADASQHASMACEEPCLMSFLGVGFAMLLPIAVYALFINEHAGLISAATVLSGSFFAGLLGQLKKPND